MGDLGTEPLQNIKQWRWKIDRIYICLGTTSLIKNRYNYHKKHSMSHLPWHVGNPEGSHLPLSVHTAQRFPSILYPLLHSKLISAPSWYPLLAMVLPKRGSPGNLQSTAANTSDSGLNIHGIQSRFIIWITGSFYSVVFGDVIERLTSAFSMLGEPPSIALTVCRSFGWEHLITAGTLILYPVVVVVRTRIFDCHSSVWQSGVTTCNR